MKGRAPVLSCARVPRGLSRPSLPSLARNRARVQAGTPDLEELTKAHPRIALLPFDSDYKARGWSGRA